MTSGSPALVAEIALILFAQIECDLPDVDLCIEVGSQELREDRTEVDHQNEL